MSRLLTAEFDTIAAEVVARLAAFDHDELPGLSATRDPWALAEAACPRIDGLLTAWLRDEHPAASLADLVLAECGSGLRALAKHGNTSRDEIRAAVAMAGDPEPVAGERLHVATVGAVLLRDDDRFRAAHAAADRLVERFERRKHPLGMTGDGNDAADLVALGLLRSTWRTLTQVTGDPRFLNAALKLAEWKRRTVPDGDLLAREPWHALRRVVGVDRHELSAGATALHLLAVERERAAVRALGAVR